MPEESSEFVASLLSEFNTKLRDLEEKNRLLKERVLLLGKNLVEIKSEHDEERVAVKEKLEFLSQETERIKKVALRLSGELDDKARKSEVELIEKQMKMFEPLKILGE